jgi:UDPglucose--hexose-1-phosphate uridylyltransferase
MASEIRQDYIHNRVVIIAPSRNKRPHDFQPHVVPPAVHKANCPFCPENESKLKIVRTYKRNGAKPWSIRAIKNIFPVVSKDNAKAYGDQEVIIETPEHDVELAELPVEHIAQLIEVYGDRVRELAKDVKIQYIMVFKNNGGRAGASIDHAHSQIFATNFLPPHVLEKLKRAEEYRIRYGHCYYCDHMKREAHSPRLIRSDEHVFVEAPYASSYNYEAWIFPRRHVDNVSLLTPRERLAFAAALKQLLVKLNAINLPYNVYLHQVVRYGNEHLYFRIAPRRDVWAGIELGSRLVVNTVAPEDAAKFYRGPEKRKKRITRRKKK